jgi:hypothetical protein
MSTDNPANPQNQGIIDYFEAALSAAREGRVLFVVASIGLVSERTVQAPAPDALPAITPVPADRTPPDRIATAKPFKVVCGAFVGEGAQGLHPVSRAGGAEDTALGAKHALTAFVEAVNASNEPAEPGRVILSS